MIHKIKSGGHQGTQGLAICHQSQNVNLIRLPALKDWELLKKIQFYNSFE
jgi:hypothetical protein